MMVTTQASVLNHEKARFIQLVILYKFYFNVCVREVVFSCFCWEES